MVYSVVMTCVHMWNDVSYDRLDRGVVIFFASRVHWPPTIVSYWNVCEEDVLDATTSHVWIYIYSLM
jgi:hypothetical protein